MDGNRVIKNASWIILCRIIQAVIGLILTMFSARYLGPSGYGLISYAASIVAFVTPIMQLGLNSTLVQEIVAHPDQEGEILGTAIAMCFVSSVACIIGVITFVCVANPGETDTIIVCGLYSASLIFQSFEIIQCWFQAKLLSKYTAITTLVAYTAMSAYKIILLIVGKSIYWFALSQVLDYCIISVVFLLIYRKIGIEQLNISFRRGKQMLEKSKYYIASSLMVTVFAQTDRVMLKLMIDESAVGFYSAAVTCAGMTSFVFGAIIDSARPAILSVKNISQTKFEDRIKLLYFFVIYLALLQSVFISVLSKWIVLFLYGPAYESTINALRIIVWYTTFSYLGSVRNIWILAEGKQRFLWIINLSGALTNVGLNLLLIPVWGINGAAIASLVTQIFTNVIIGFILKPIRDNNYLMLKSIRLGMIVSALKALINSQYN